MGTTLSEVFNPIEETTGSTESQTIELLGYKKLERLVGMTRRHTFCQVKIKNIRRL